MATVSLFNIRHVEYYELPVQLETHCYLVDTTFNSTLQDEADEQLLDFINVDI